ncbi:hypothetical protein [Halostagnicola sp. A-GB9-2]|uniref:hypothetical protein n=1 Tax=Halostagnicola sp. A-GB9-2 TaxID=3048066 RepID=UPI0024C082A8|nr:hypothetical protein [Halostagnicola sp. A-GB9-2]MDJ1430741.1 hypothetical protein [Halostagnicola sp. A-GB9-2]
MKQTKSEAPKSRAFSHPITDGIGQSNRYSNRTAIERDKSKRTKGRPTEINPAETELPGSESTETGLPEIEPTEIEPTETRLPEEQP